MPTYEYECNKCKKTFDVFQSIKAKPLKKCPTCSSPVERLIGAGGGFLFKGSGFYTTDYRSKSYKEKAQKEKPLTCPKVSGKGDCSTCSNK